MIYDIKVYDLPKKYKKITESLKNYTDYMHMIDRPFDEYFLSSSDHANIVNHIHAKEKDSDVFIVFDRKEIKPA